MIFAELFWICLWPFLLLLIALQRSVRDPAMSGWIGPITMLFGTVSLIFLVAFGQSSLIAVFDIYFIAVAIGAGLIWRGFRDLRDFIPDLKTKLTAYALMLVGGGIAFVPAWTFFQDFFQPRLVYQGRVQNVRVQGSSEARRAAAYAVRVADIDGHTVKMTTPVYEELKLRPVVRVQVGRGSNYVYDFEHLAD
jgi:hypothetical protein